MVSDNPADSREIIEVGHLESRTLLIRGRRVMVDADLAELYGVSTKRLNEQVKRSAERFPEDFSFKLTREEKSEVVAICDHLSRLRFSHALPRVFTEHGAIMAGNVPNSPLPPERDSGSRYGPCREGEII